MKAAYTKQERVRRVRLGDLRRLFRDRYGPTLPDDDAGREDLHELLLVVSLAPAEVVAKMQNEIEILAPWLGAEEAAALLDDVMRTPRRQRWRSAADLGQAMQLTSADRERLRAWTIGAFDMTAEAAAEYRKFKKRMQARRRRRKTPRDVYLAKHSLSRQKPWQAEGVSRATWYRRHRRRTETGMSPAETL